jgi:hypothetical protein
MVILPFTPHAGLINVNIGVSKRALLNKTELKFEIQPCASFVLILYVPADKLVAVGFVVHVTPSSKLKNAAGVIIVILPKSPQKAGFVEL